MPNKTADAWRRALLAYAELPQDAVEAELLAAIEPAEHARGPWLIEKRARARATSTPSGRGRAAAATEFDGTKRAARDKRIAKHLGIAQPPAPEPERPDAESGSGRTLVALGDVIRSGVALAYEGRDLPAHKRTREPSWSGWADLARWVRDKARLAEVDDEIAIAKHLVRCFFRNTKAEDEGYPIEFLAQNPTQYWRDAELAESA